MQKQYVANITIAREYIHSFTSTPFLTFKIMGLWSTICKLRSRLRFSYLHLGLWWKGWLVVSESSIIYHACRSNLLFSSVLQKFVRDDLICEIYLICLCYINHVQILLQSTISCMRPTLERLNPSVHIYTSYMYIMTSLLTYDISISY